MEQNTHPRISTELVGTPRTLSDGAATVELLGRAEMAADERGLVHGGFTFGLADYAAMLAVNDPNVVLGGADCRFLAPVRVGELMVAEARVTAEKGRKRTVDVTVTVGETAVLNGTLTCFVLDHHVLDSRA